MSKKGSILPILLLSNSVTNYAILVVETNFVFKLSVF